jgi:RNA recognition motif-containing protein
MQLHRLRQNLVIFGGNLLSSLYCARKEGFMSKELYVGHMSYEATEKDLIRLFTVAGTVTSVHLIVDPETGEFKGCGYVRMSTAEEAQEAVATLDGALLRNRSITVSIARPQKQKTRPGAGRPGKGRPGGSFSPSSRGKSTPSTPGSRRAGVPGTGTSEVSRRADGPGTRSTEEGRSTGRPGTRAAEKSRWAGGPDTRTGEGSRRTGGPGAGRGKSGPGTGPGGGSRGKSGPGSRFGKGKK